VINDIKKLGGLAALAEAAAYLVGFVLYFLLLDASDYDGPLGQVAFLVDHQDTLFAANLLIYIAASFFLVVLVLALHERLRTNSSALVQIATTFGLIWAGLVMASGMIFGIGTETVVDLYATDPAQAATVWLTIRTVHDALGGGTEIVGGLWILLLSWAAWRSGQLPRALNGFGVAIGVAGIVSVIPSLGVLNIVFGLSQILWFIWMGIILLRAEPGSGA